MAKFILRRIAIAIPIVLIVTIITFLLIDLAPYDAVDAMIDPKMSAETVAAMKEQMGLTKPVWATWSRATSGIRS